MENAGMKKFLWELSKLFFRWLWGYVVLVPVVMVVGVMFVSSPGVPPDCLTGQWMWLGEMGVVAGLTIMVLVVGGNEMLKRLPGFAVWTLIVLGGVEAVLGLLQVFGLRESNHALFTLTGSFYNPGPYSGYLALVLPLAVNELIRYSLSKGIPFYTALTVTLLIVCVLPAGMSRAAWLAAGVSVVFLLDRWLGLHRLFVPKGWRARLVAAVCLVVIAASAAGMYLMKKDSADGRLLVWKISLSEAMKQPFDRIESRTFSAVYGEAQEEYFSRNGYTAEEERVAEVPDFAFNEYIQAFMMTGIFGLGALLLVLVLSMLLCRREKTFGVSGAILSVGIFAFFSYPFHIPAIVAAFVLLVIVAFTDYFYKDGEPRNAVVSGAVMSLVVFVMLVSGVQCFFKNEREACFIPERLKARMLYNTGAYGLAVESYQRLYGMDNNADYRFELARSLYKTGCYQQAKDVLEKTLWDVSGDPMILNLMGKSEHAMRDYEQAEAYYLRSITRVPGRIYPYYLLVKLYSDPEYYRPDKLKQAADVVLNKEPKVMSTAVRQMREEVSGILRKKIYEKSR